MHGFLEMDPCRTSTLHGQACSTEADKVEGHWIGSRILEEKRDGLSITL